MKTVCIVLALAVFLWISGTLISRTEAMDFKFPEIAGWKQSDEIQTFVPTNLFEFIDGAADLYLMYDFQELNVAEYHNEKKATMSVEVYRHKNPLYAFGIYSRERLSNATILDIGAQGYSEKNLLNFFTGSYYVKINSYDTGAGDDEILRTLAKKVAENLGEKGSLPSILSMFPDEGKIKNTEKFIPKKFLGYPFLHSAFTADYSLPGKEFKLFVIAPGDNLECKKMIAGYLEQVKGAPGDIAEGPYTISDPYNGEVDLTWQGAYIWGTLNLNDATLRSSYLKMFEERIRKIS